MSFLSEVRRSRRLTYAAYAALGLGFIVGSVVFVALFLAVVT